MHLHMTSTRINPLYGHYTFDIPEITPMYSDHTSDLSPHEKFPLSFDTLFSCFLLESISPPCPYYFTVSVSRGSAA